MKKYIKLALALLLVYSANAGEIRQSAYEGSRFLLGFIQNSLNDNIAYNTLQTFAVVLPNENGSLTVKYSGVTQNYTLKKNIPLKIQFPKTLEVKTAGVKTQSVIDLTSTVQFTVIALSNELQSSESYNLIPVANWGKNYVVSSMPNDSIRIGKNSYLTTSEFLVIASENATNVEIVAPVATNNVNYSYKKVNITLNAGEAYLVQSSTNLGIGEGDLSGATVNATAPIGIIAGHVRTGAPTGWNSNNHIAEMLPPKSVWGKYFITIPSAIGVNAELYRVIPQSDNTVLTVSTDNEVKTYNLTSANNVYNISSVGSNAFWKSSSPVQICMIFSHNGSANDNQNFDPAMTYLSPVEQSVSSASFFSFDSSFSASQYYAFTSHYVNLIFDKNSYDDINLDGVLIKNLSRNIKQISGSNYFGVKLQINSGFHKINSNNGYFTGYFYGTASQDAYASTLGATFKNPFESDKDVPNVQVQKKCANYTISINDKISWNYSGISYVKAITDSLINFTYKIDPIYDSTSVAQVYAEPIDKSKDGKITIEFADRNGNIGRKTINYIAPSIVYTPVIDFGVIPINTQITKTITLFNPNSDTLKIDSISLSSNAYFLIKTKLSFPILIAPKASLIFDVVNYRRTDNNTLTSKINYYYACTLKASAQLIANEATPNISISPKPLNFPATMVGDTARSYVTIENTGTVKINLSLLEFSGDNTAFTLVASDVNGKDLEIGAKIKLNALFHPKAGVTYAGYVNIKNNYNLSANFTMIGEGMTANLKSSDIKFAPQRIGFAKDSVIEIINIGNSDCKISFKSIAGDSADFDLSAIKAIKDITVSTKSPLKLNFKSIPSKRGNINAKILFASNWKNQADVAINLSSFGLLPELKADTSSIDTIICFSAKDFKVKVLENHGNEKTTIEKIELIGDPNTFIFKEFPQNIEILPDSVLNLQFRFSPKKKGVHSAVLKFTSNSAQNFALTEHYALIQAYALPNDTFRAETRFFSNPKANACQVGEAEAFIVNTGNAPILLQSIKSSGENFYSKIINEDSILNKSFAPNDTLKFVVEYLLERNQSGVLKISAILNDTVKIETSSLIEPIAEKIIISGDINKEIIPGKLTTLDFSGSVPNQTNTNYPFGLGIKFQPEDFEIGMQNPYFEFTDVDGVKSREPAIIELFNYDSVSVKSKINLNGSTFSKWSLTLEAMPLLGKDKLYEISATAYAENCFESHLANSTYKVVGICSFGNRQILINDKKSFLSINPLPATQDLHIELLLAQNDRISIVAQDQLGKNISIIQNLNLQKGKHYLNFEIPNIANGLYNLKVQLTNSELNQLFIVNK